MRKTISIFPRSITVDSRQYASATAQSAIIHIDNATFYRRYPSSTTNDDHTNAAIFPRLSFSLPSLRSEQHWAVIGPSSSGKTTFLEVLRGQHICIPPTARSYPYLSSTDVTLERDRPRSLSAAIQYVGSGSHEGGLGVAGSRGTYMSARYESRKEDTDFTLMKYLTGDTALNPYEQEVRNGIYPEDLERAVYELRLGELVDMPVGNLSNGQTRRARIAKALLGKPDLLLLDEVFLGLDPPSRSTLSRLLFKMAQTDSPRMLLSLRPQDYIPEWITHLLILKRLDVQARGPKDVLLKTNRIKISEIPSTKANPSIEAPAGILNGRTTTPPTANVLNGGLENFSPSLPTRLGMSTTEEPVVEMRNVVIKYGNKQIFGGCTQESAGKTQTGLNWTVRRGERWGIFGSNGSGKTSLLSLISSDHPQVYSLPIRIFGRGRLPQLGQPGISIFDIQTRIGQSSPEIHAFFPRHLTLRQTVENAWAETFLGTPKLTQQCDEIVNTVLQWFEQELNVQSRPSEIENMEDSIRAIRDTAWANELCFRDVSFSSQRLLLFIRAVVKRPELVILDEAFSGMDDNLRDKCMLFLEHGVPRSYVRPHTRDDRVPRSTLDGVQLENQVGGLDDTQALICVSHVKEEVPGAVRDWICLPEMGSDKLARVGRLSKPLHSDESGWNEIWGM